MSFKSKHRFSALLGGVALLCAIPALSQDKPESILPPGFGEPDAPSEKPAIPDAEPKKQAGDLVPDIELRIPQDQNGTASGSVGQNALAVDAGLPTEEATDGDSEFVAPVLQDLPPSLRRSTAKVGILASGDHDMGEAAFSGVDGKFMSQVMRRIKAPIASRWASIALRRALLTRSNTPSRVNGADWVAERAWLLLRMGEADSARMLVQAVDVDQYTPKMFDVAMQASLASADPAGMCPMVEPAIARKNPQPAWLLARAMCAGLSGESAQAAALIDVARSKTKARGLDALLPEKVIGAGGNTRRAVNIQWDGVRVLTAWRFGLASATGIEIPDSLMATVGVQVLAWQARSPLLDAVQRNKAADMAAGLGVFSSSALVDHYASVFEATDVSARSGSVPMVLRTAFAGSDEAARVSAARQLWADPALSETTRYSRLLLTSRAAAMVAPSNIFSGDIDLLIASMLSSGLDIYADRWALAVGNASGEPGMRARGLLAVGGTKRLSNFGRVEIDTYQTMVGGEGGRKGSFLFASLAALGRISSADISARAERYDVPVGRQTSWTRALERAIAAKATGAVVLLCAAGLQGKDWSKVPAGNLYHVVSALTRMGFEAEARMIAAEALTRV